MQLENEKKLNRQLQNGNEMQSDTIQYYKIADDTNIPDNCHLLNRDKIFRAKILHPNARKSGQIGFCDKIA